MNDLKNHIKRFQKKFPDIAEGFEDRYQEFRLGVLIREARKNAGLTQEELASLMATKKTAISRLENQSEDARISTIAKIAAALGKRLEIRFV